MGPQGVAGPVGLSFQGNYSSVVNYALANGVRYNGADYVSLQPATTAILLIRVRRGGRSSRRMERLARLGQRVQPVDGRNRASRNPGHSGDPGSQGPTGPPGMTYKGVWSSTTGYQVNDSVSYNGSTYIATVRQLVESPGQLSHGMVVDRGSGVAGDCRVPPARLGQRVRRRDWTARPTGATGPQGPPVTFPRRVADWNLIRVGRRGRIWRLQLYLLLQMWAASRISVRCTGDCSPLPGHRADRRNRAPGIAGSHGLRWTVWCNRATRPCGANWTNGIHRFSGVNRSDRTGRCNRGNRRGRRIRNQWHKWTNGSNGAPGPPGSTSTVHGLPAMDTQPTMRSVPAPRPQPTSHWQATRPPNRTCIRQIWSLLAQAGGWRGRPAQAAGLRRGRSPPARREVGIGH